MYACTCTTTCSCSPSAIVHVMRKTGCFHYFYCSQKPTHTHTHTHTQNLFKKYLVVQGKCTPLIVQHGRQRTYKTHTFHKTQYLQHGTYAPLASYPGLLGNEANAPPVDVHIHPLHIILLSLSTCIRIRMV